MSPLVKFRRQARGEIMTAWQRAWREGFAPQFSLFALKALAKALLADDPMLLQGATCSPPPLESMRGEPAVAVCPVGMCVQEEGAMTVGEVEDGFARACIVADERLGKPSACRDFICWFDDTPRLVARNELLHEVNA